jgi:hypothetical protein
VEVFCDAGTGVHTDRNELQKQHKETCDAISLSKNDVSY